MANKKISELPLASEVAQSDSLLLLRGNSNYRITGKEFCEYLADSANTVYLTEDGTVPVNAKIMLDKSALPSQGTPITASVDGTTLTIRGADAGNAVLKFKNLNTGNWEGVPTVGISGADGLSISAIELQGSTSGQPGTTDTYKVRLSDGTLLPTAISVYNGKNSSGLYTVDGQNADSNQNFDTNILTNDQMILCVGDSYLEGYKDDGSHCDKTWADIIADTLGGSSPDDKVVKLSGETHYGMWKGGCGFGALSAQSTGDPALNMYTLLQIKTASVPVATRKKVGLIIAACGYNDGDTAVGKNPTEETVLTGITNFCTYAKANYPNARIIIADVGWASEGEDGGFTTERKLLIPSWYSEGAAENGVECYADAWRVLAHRYDAMCTSGGSEWGKHPSDLGQQLLAKAFLLYISNGHVSDDAFYVKHTHDFTNSVHTDKNGTIVIYRNLRHTVVNITSNATNNACEIITASRPKEGNANGSSSGFLSYDGTNDLVTYVRCNSDSIFTVNLMGYISKNEDNTFYDTCGIRAKFSSTGKIGVLPISINNGNGFAGWKRVYVTAQSFEIDNIYL